MICTLHSSSTRLYHWTSICSSRKDYPCLKETSLEDKITHEFRQQLLNHHNKGIKFQESTSTLKLAPNYPSCTITVASCFSCEAPGHCCSSFGEFSHSFWSNDFSVQLYLFSFVFSLIIIISACYISLICASCMIYFYLSLPHFLPCCHFEWCQKGSSWFAQLP